MIIPESETDKSLLAKQDAQTDLESTLTSPTVNDDATIPTDDDPARSDPPPKYDVVVLSQHTAARSGAGDTTPPGASSTSITTTAPHDLQTCNFVAMTRRNGSLKGAWLIDPAMIIPEELLAPLEDCDVQGERKNALLQSRNGEVDVDIFVLPVNRAVMEANKVKGCVSLQTKSWNGEVKTRVHDITSTTDVRLPIKLNTASSNGSLHIYLPRTFRGPLHLTTLNGSVRFSDALRSQTHIFSETRNVQRCFLGQFDSSEWTGSDKWAGDEVVAETRNGSIKVYFDDEATTGWGKPKAPGFLERLFGFGG